MDIQPIEKLLATAKQGPLPRHVAIIMDGNGRWAQERGLPRIAGHRAGIRSVREIVTLARELEIPCLTLYAFSLENWQRPPREITQLMGLLEQYLKRELKMLKAQDIKVKTIGMTHDLPPRVVHWIRTVEEETRLCRKMTLVLALSYGGRAEIVMAARRLMNEACLGRLRGDDVDEACFTRHLDTDGLPDPDLMIRTSGEARISNFLLWQMAYTELYFTKTPWPDFHRRDLLQALLDYQRRERRFGLVREQVRSG